MTGASADAATLLNMAADRAQVTPDSTVGPGQYRYAVTHAWYGTGVMGLPEDPQRTVYYLTEQKYEVWIPHEESGTWYWRWVGPAVQGLLFNEVLLFVCTGAGAAFMLLMSALFRWRRGPEAPESA